MRSAHCISSVSTVSDSSIDDTDVPYSYYTSKKYFDMMADEKKRKISKVVSEKRAPVVGAIARGQKYGSREDLRNAIIAKNYKKYDSKTYVLKDGAQPLIKDAMYVGLDMCHYEFEVYDKRGKHLGAVDPDTLELYKDPVKGRKINIK